MFRWTRAARRQATALALSICATGHAYRAPLHAQPSPVPAALTIELTRSPGAYRPRVERAAREALDRYTEWLGPGPAGPITVTDRGAEARERSTAPREGVPYWVTARHEGVPYRDVAVTLPWPSSPASMDVESQVAYEMARRWWGEPSPDPSTRALVDGIAWYLQSRIVERVFDQVYLREAYGAETVRFFGGHVPWAFPGLLRSRWTAGLAHSRDALAMGTLERYLGWPALQLALREAATEARARPLMRADIEQRMAAATGQDLAWFFDVAFDPARRIDYAVVSVTTEAGGTACGATSCFTTRVDVANRGTAPFTGSSREPVGPYEAGDAIEVDVAFADGTRVATSWDGRAASKTFAFESAAPAVAAHLDPRGVLLLDANRLDNDWRQPAATNIRVTRWAAQWLVWLQNAMLSYAALI